MAYHTNGYSIYYIGYPNTKLLDMFFGKFGFWMVGIEGTWSVSEKGATASFLHWVTKTNIILKRGYVRGLTSFQAYKLLMKLPKPTFSHVKNYLFQILIKSVNSILMPCMQTDNIEYILVTSLLSDTVL